MLKTVNGKETWANSKIFVLAEVTSNAVAETDQLMQKLIREEFGNYTILTVAHRLDTILDTDGGVIMDGGRGVEMDEGMELLRETRPLRRETTVRRGSPSC
jgi:ABC-type multidrug transport system fused ATPase/permease subunit